MGLTLSRFECTCLSFNHNVRFEVDNDDGRITISIPLNHYLPWWKRVWIGLKYIFGSTKDYDHYDTILLNPSDYGKIKELVSNSEIRIKT